uniref:translation initiation factor 2 n=1 Tax=Galdieria phlegrea TaxID=1389228 RepID=UPI0023D87B25|nr:translation initiation factor 2 [Galdieria phlegrea]UNJ16182.1 translation initiation factor 2 [Galdieria sp.]WDA99766.1 translation initiation factor 2 [Galdieria phlegrea]
MNKINNNLEFNGNEDEHFIEYYNNKNYKSDLLKANKNNKTKNKKKSNSNLKSIEKNRLNYNNKENKFILNRKAYYNSNENINFSSDIVYVEENITVNELASKIGIEATEVLKILFKKGKLLNINQILDSFLLNLISQELKINITTIDKKNNVYINNESNNDQNINNTQLKTRAPIVAVLGHVNHGKTSLIEKLIKTELTKTEIGHITQHIGAHEFIIRSKDKKIILLDTPGHEAFESIRQRVLKISDIILLIIAADEGIQQETSRIIQSLKNSESSILIVITKVDKIDAKSNIPNILQNLTEYGLIAEELGGDIPTVNVSIFDKKSLEFLLDMILLIGEIKNLKTDPIAKAEGIVLSTYLDKNKVPRANLILQKGRITVGDIIIAGQSFARIRSLFNAQGEKISESEAVSLINILGIPELIKTGEFFEKVETEKEAKSKIEELKNKRENVDFKQIVIKSNNKLNLDIDEETTNINLLIKADVQDSVEAVIGVIRKNVNNLDGNIKITIIRAEIGEVSLNDINLAAITKAYIIGFNIKISKNIQKIAHSKQIVIKIYNLIYDLFEDFNNLIQSLVKANISNIEVIGKAVVKTVFNLAKGKVAGCLVLEGKLVNNFQIQVLRNNIIMYKGKLESLKFEKHDIEEIYEGQECGILCKNFQSWKENDIIECISS